MHNVMSCLSKLNDKVFRFYQVSYFMLTIQNKTVSLSQFVLENSSREDKHECPFARSSIQLTLILCEILRIGEPRRLTCNPFVS